MNDIASQLRQAREARGLSLEHIQKATRIKRVYLEAIEAGRFQDLPGMVQARGFVRSYASQVGLDADALLSQLDGLARGPAAPPHPPDAVRPSAPSRAPSPRLATLSLPLPVLLLGAILLFALGGFLLIRALGGESPAPTSALAPSVPLATSQALDPTPTLEVTAGVSLTLTASEHVWVRVSQDGFTVFEGMLEPDEPQTWRGDQQIILETGNGAALNVAVNGRPAGILGPRNRIVVRAWGAEGEVTPAPTAIPVTPEATTTPSP